MIRKIPAAIRDGDIEALKMLLAQDPSAIQLRTEQGLSFLLLAMYYGRRDMAEVLRGDGAHLDMFEAAAMGDIARVRALAAKDPAMINTCGADGVAPLHLACFFGHVEMAEMLLKAGADPNITATNSRHARPLHSATVQTDHPAAESLTRLLLAAGADPNVKWNGGRQPIHCAVVNGHEGAARLLMAAGADRNARTDDGKTPAMLLAEKLLQGPL